jgi:hypothetical protein
MEKIKKLSYSGMRSFFMNEYEFYRNYILKDPVEKPFSPPLWV